MDRAFLTEQFSKWCSSIDYAAMPNDVRWAARRAILDTIGVITAGSRHPATERARQAFGGSPGEAAVVGGGLADTASAALINGTAAHTYDFDDTSYTGIMHGSAVIIPAIVAAASEAEVSNDRILEAFIVGSEIAYTLADVATHRHYFRGWWSTATYGVVGATAAVAKIYGLDSGATSHAIGLAAAGAATARSIIGTDAKPFMAGDAARRAIDFAKAARAGMSGPVDAFENNRGFFSLLNDHHAEWGEAQTLGKRWRLIEPGLLFKRYPVCSAAHAAIEQTASLFAEAECQEDDIERIICEVPELVDITLVFDDPSTAQQAQFSLQFVVACAVLYGEVRLEHISRETLSNPMVRKLMTRIEQKVDRELSTEEMCNKYPEGARITLFLEDGRWFSGFCGEVYGMPQRPLSDADLTMKFCDCLKFAGHQPDFAMQIAKVLLGSGDDPAPKDFCATVKEIWNLPSRPDVGTHGSTAPRAGGVAGTADVEVTRIGKEFLSNQGGESGLQ